MAKELQTYTRQSTLENMPVVDAGAPLDAMAASIGKFNEQIDRIAQRQTNYQAGLEGTEAGSNLNYQPIKNPVTDADFAYNNAALEANKMAISSRARDDILQAREDVLKPGNFSVHSIDAFNARAKGISDAILSEVPREHQVYAKNVLDHYIVSNSEVVQNHVNELGRQQILFDFQTNIDKFQKDSVNAAFKGDGVSSAAIMHQAENAINAARSQGLISGTHAANLIDGWKDQLHATTYLGQFNKAIESGKPHEYLTDFQKAENTGLDFFQKKKVYTQMLGMLNEHNQQMEIEGFNLEEQIKDEVTRLYAGESPNTQLETTVKEFYPQQYAKFKDLTQAAALEGTAIKQLQFAPIGQRAELLTALKPDINEPGISRKMNVYNKVLEANQKQISELEKDPAGYVQNAPAVKQALQSYQMYGPTLSASMNINPFQTMINTQKALGVSPDKYSVISTAAASNLVANIKTMPMDQQVKTLTSLAEQYGKYAPIAFRDLAKNGLPLQAQMLVGMQNNPKSINMIPDALNAFSQDTKVLAAALPNGKTLEKDVLPKVQSELQDYVDTLKNYNGPTASTIATVYNNTAQLAMQIMLSQHMNADLAAAVAARSTIGNNYSFTSIGKSPVRIPIGIDTSMAKRSAAHVSEGIKNAKLSVPSMFYPGVSEERAAELYKKDLSAGIGWVTSPDDTQLIAVDRYNNPIKDINNNNFIVKFDDLNNPSSEIRQSLHKKQVEDARQILTGKREASSIEKMLTSGKSK
jgi:hypothetical protein